MAVIYLRSTDGSDSDDGSTWALAKATLAAALTAAGAGGTVYVSQNHAETQATAMMLASPGTVGAITNIICANDSAEPPTTLATSATVSTTGASNISFTGAAYYYGITFNVGSADNTASFGLNRITTYTHVFDTCSLVLNNTNAASKFNFGTSSGSVHDQTFLLKSSTLLFGHTGQSVAMTIANLTWINGGIDGAVAPTTLFSGTLFAANVLLDGVDLSLLGSGKYLVAANLSTIARFRFTSCKLGVSVAVINGAIIRQGGNEVCIDNCDSGDTNYRMEHYKYQGSIKAETSKIRSGGASDGTTPISWNMTTLSGASFVSPLESPPISIWNETTGSSKTVTVEIAQDNAATALNNNEAWLEVEYLGTSGYPESVIASNRAPNILTAGSAQPTSSATWNNMTTPTKQYLSVSFTPVKKGPFIAKVMLAKASTTVYVDPILTVA